MMTTAISDLQQLLANLSPQRQPGVYAFVCADAAQLQGIDLLATMREAEGLTAIMTEADALSRGLLIQFRAAWIRLQVHSDLQAVGLTAAFASALAQQRIPCNVMAGVHHDHLFVPVERADDAMLALRQLALDHCCAD